MENIVSAIGSALLTGTVFFLGGFDVAIQILLVSILLDYITGVANAIYTKTFSASIGIQGVIKKLGILIIVAVSVIVDRLIGDTGAIRNLVIYFCVSNDLISIIEHWGKMGLPIPQVLLDKISLLKNKQEVKTQETIESVVEKIGEEK